MAKKQFFSRFKYKENEIQIWQEDYATKRRHHTRRYREAMKIVDTEKIVQKPIETVLEWYFNVDKTVSIREKKSVGEIKFCPESKIIVMRMGLGEKTYEFRNQIARKTGWYFYVTGLELPTSDLSLKVDAVKRRFSTSSLNWVSSSDNRISLTPIACGPDQNSFLLKLGDKSVLLDAGFDPSKIEIFPDMNMKPDAVFISHSHKDHSNGLLYLVEKFPDVPIFLSQTTLDFLLHIYGAQSRDFTPVELKLIENSVTVKNLDEIEINGKNVADGEDKVERADDMDRENDVDRADEVNRVDEIDRVDGVDGADRKDGYFKFFFAGHMPGALMILIDYCGFKFLYTGDYTLYNYKPIPGVYDAINEIPSSIDFLLVEGCFASEEFNPPGQKFDFLRRMAEIKAKYANNVLIGADPASSAILIFNDLHRFFLKIKELQNFEKRPVIFLSRNVYEYAQILCMRTQDLHPQTARIIKNELNPFCSSMIRWINDHGDKIEAEKKLRKRDGKGNIIIYDPPSLNSGWIKDFFKIVASRKHNAVYLAGRLSGEAAQDLVSGTDVIKLERYTKKTGEIQYEMFYNRADVQNRLNPKNIFILHADKFQFLKFIERIRPKKLCFFHTNPAKLTELRTQIERLTFLKETFAFSAKIKRELRLN